MERSGLVDQLPDALAVAIRLDDAGHDHMVIGTALGVPHQSVKTVLRVARAKLASLQADESRADEEGDERSS